MSDERRRSGGGRGRKAGSGRGGQGGKSGKGQGQGRGRGGRPLDDRERLERPLARILERLPAAQREVLEWRMGLKDGHPHNLSDTAKELGLSMSEARDIERRAFEHIREAVPVEHLQKFLQG